MKKTITWTRYTDDGEEELELPARYEVCGRCNGHGCHDHPAFSNGITASEWRDEWDCESREDYLAGRYDVTCEECEGLRVVLEVDEWTCDPKLLEEYRADMQDRAQQEAEDASIRRMESGGYY
jgi:DnaJ-class molecular chaperone